VEQVVHIPSDGLQLAGVLTIPPGLKEGERRPAFLILHGFGSTKESENVLGPARLLQELGYVTLRFDMRGCGESEGEHGRVICLEQVADTRNAVSFLAQQAHIDRERIAVIGTSFGGAVAVYAGGTDVRIAAVISNGGWGDGERKFRGQHSTPEAWERFTRILEEGPRYRERTGKSMMVPRFDIVPVPPHVQQNLANQSVQMFPSRTLLEFPAETVQSMFEFKADTVVGNIAPRPLLLLHSASDSVTPTEQSISLFQHAGQPAELHLFSDVDHWMFAENSSRVWSAVREWLNKYLPISAFAGSTAR
jgi:dipeptidyl aminopeptidase/acylaminoacyl peptidase